MIRGIWFITPARTAALQPVASLATLLMLTLGASAQTPAERGRYLVNTIMACGNCHTPKDPSGTPITSKGLSGGLIFNTPIFSGNAPNITPDPESGLGRWSDADIKRAIMEGVR